MAEQGLPDRILVFTPAHALAEKAVGASAARGLKVAALRS
jgi:hypothetical protein